MEARTNVRRFLASALLLLSVTAAGGALAQTPPGESPARPGGEGQGRPAGPPHPVRVSPLMAALDTDKNGDLSAEEISRAAVALKTLDKDRNGRLTPNELRPAPRPVIIPPADIVERLLEFDRNSDGKLTRAELPERLKSFFDQVDGSQDGVLTQAELTAFVEKSEAERRKAEERRIEAEQRAGSSAPPPLPAQPGGAGGPAGGHGPSPRVAPAMAALDTDKNGELSAEEIANAAAALKILDKDSDGKLSAEELRPVPLPGPREGGHP